MAATKKRAAPAKTTPKPKSRQTSQRAARPAEKSARSTKSAAKSAPAARSAAKSARATKPAAKSASATRSAAKAAYTPKPAAKAAPKRTPAKSAPSVKIPTPKVEPTAASKRTPTKIEPSVKPPAPKVEAATAPAQKPKPKKPTVTWAGGISSDAVQRRTGKSWDDWFEILDAAGARDLDHKSIVAILAQRHGVGPWWQQMVTEAYRQVRGKSDQQRTESGFQASADKTLNIPLARLFRMWNDTEQRAVWLSDERFQIKKASSGKSIRARWGRGTSHVDVFFQDRGGDRSAVSVRHNQIENRHAAEQMQAYWTRKLDALEKALT